MADIARQTKKLKNPYVDWKNRPYATDANAEEKRQRAERFEALNQFVTEHHSWVVSAPGNKRVRIEAPPNMSSALAGKLTNLGYRVAIGGPATRIVPNAITENFKDAAGKPVVRQHAGIVDVDVLEITLPGK
jgi:hypothetical protein